MRIIGGFHRGRRITPPAKITARPTMDYAREALFNILSNRYDFDDMEVLDLFAGSGMISYEFASRAANKVVAIDSDKSAVDFIRKTTAQLNLKIEVYNADVFRYLKTATQQFDLVFADPPYDLAGLHELPKLIFEKHVLVNDGIFILEHDKRHQFQNLSGFCEQRKYGNTFFSIFSQPLIQDTPDI